MMLPPPKGRPVRILLAFALIGCSALAQVIPPIRPVVVINCPSEDIVTECAGPNGTPVTFDITATSLIGGTPTVTCTPPSGSLFAPGATPVNCRATNTLGNSASCSFKVQVNDTQPPQLQVPASIETGCDQASGQVVHFEVNATDTCDSGLIPICVPPSGSLFPIGVTTVNCLVRDGGGNLARASFPVTVRDIQPPALDVPGRMVFACDSAAGHAVAFTVTATDNCDTNLHPICSPPSGSVFSIGTTTVHCLVRDGAGNLGTNAFEVVISGDCASCVELICPAAPIQLEAGPLGTAVANYGNIATNHCGGGINFVSDPPVGSDLPVGTHRVTCAVETGAETVQRCVFDVVVRDVTPPVIKAPREMTVLCDGLDQTGKAYAQIHYPVTAKDNTTSQPILTIDPVDGAIVPLGQFTAHVTARDAYGNTTERSILVTVKSGPDCEFDASPPVLEVDYNWDFEDGLRTWTPTGDAFKFQPTFGDNITVRRVAELVNQFQGTVGGDYWHDLLYPIGHHGDHWIGTAERHRDDQTVPGSVYGDHATGSLVSPLFVIEHDKRAISFLIGGQRDEEKLRVELLVKTLNNTPGDVQLADGWYRIAFHATGHGEERLRREMYFAEDLTGEHCRIRILDQSETGHLNVDDFRFEQIARLFAKVQVAGREIDSLIVHQGRFYDWDSPVWGLADLHTHPMSHLGLGQKVFHGQPDGDIATALSDCGCDHGGWGFDNGCGNYLRQLVMSAFDGESTTEPHRMGWNDNPAVRFQRWPLFSSYSHQQMWHEWIKRAYDGGLRVMVALTVNGEVIAKAMHESIKPYDDLSVMENQIRELKSFVQRHSDFMEIAYDPFDLRRIVRDNKLAIIMGSETDQIGNFNRNPDVKEDADETSKTIVRTELQRLHGLGLRYIFPVHLTDSKLGGSAIYNPVFAIATKDAMQRPLLVEGVNDGISFRLPSLDATSYLPSGDEVAKVVADTFLDPFAPFRLFAETNGKMMGDSGGFSESSLGFAGVGAIATMPLVLAVAAPLAPLLPDAIADFSSLEISSDLYPIGGNYPNYPEVGKGRTGHRNARGLSKLGEFAVTEMMKLGMMIDIDHMAYHGVTNLLARARQVPGGYPLNSGHNSFRALRYETSENNRTPEQLEQIRELGGMMGVGWGNADVRYADDGLGHPPTNSTSFVANNCAGTSRSFAQSAIYGLEMMQRRQLAFGSDINGFVVGPGPRFGPQSDFGLREEAIPSRSGHIAAQENGIAYFPRDGRPGATGVFNGKGVDQSTEAGQANPAEGYRYNREQRDFFVALRIFRWGESQNPRWTHQQYIAAAAAMHPAYNIRRLQDLLCGLTYGKTDGTPGKDILDGDVEARQKIAKAVYRRKLLQENPPQEFYQNSQLWDRWKQNLRVWEDYEKIYGANVPMHRCQTAGVQWDYNFDGLAHYGMLPDFFQDLANVDLEANDMSPFFQSAEGFARMWTHTLQGSWRLTHPLVLIGRGLDERGNPRHYSIQWAGDETDRLEFSDNPADPNSWRPYEGTVEVRGLEHFLTLVGGSNASARFFRVRKP